MRRPWVWRFNDVINALVSLVGEAVVPPAVVYFDEDDDWTLSLNYHRLFILFNKLLSLGIRRIEIKDQYGDPLNWLQKFISSYSDYQSDRATVKLHLLSLHSKTNQITHKSCHHFPCLNFFKCTPIGKLPCQNTNEQTKSVNPLQGCSHWQQRSYHWSSTAACNWS